MSDEILIPKASESNGPELTWLKEGIHNVTIKDVEQKKDKSGEAFLNKNGDPGLEFVLVDGEGKDYRETFWIGEKNQWVLDKFCEKIGVDNSNKGLPKSAVLGKRVWLALGNKYPMTANGDFIMSDDGKWRKKFLFTVGTYKFDTNLPDSGKPKLEGKFTDDKEGPTTGSFFASYTKAGSIAPQVKSSPTNNSIGNEDSETVIVEGWE